MIQRIHRFKRLLQTKEREEDLLREELGNRQREKMSLETRMEKLRGEKEEALASFGRRAVEATTVQELWMSRCDLDRIGRNLDENGRSLALAVQGVESAREELLLKHREVRTFETALDGYREIWRTECLKKEQALLDDMTSSRVTAMASMKEGGDGA